MNANTIKVRRFNMANYLGSEEDATEYLNQVLADGDPAELAAALDDIARAQHRTLVQGDEGIKF